MVADAPAAHAPDSAAPVFILSTARSGSTLLRLTLGKLPAVVSLPESHFYVFRERQAGADLTDAAARRRLAEAWADFQRIRKWPIDHARLRDAVAAGGTSWRRVLELTVERYVADALPGAPGRYVWCEKSPPHVFRRDAIRADFPEARFLHLVRDPRDVAASLKTCPWAASSVYVSARVWRRAAEEIRPADDTLRIHYERLVQAPEVEVARIAEFLGTDFDPACLGTTTEDAVEEHNVRSAASLEPISAHYAGIWRERLSRPDRDVEIVQHVCRDAMTGLGYSLARERRDGRFRARLALGWLSLAVQRFVG